MHYDIIGDIHGHVVPLINLLGKLGYINDKGYYRHPDGRKVIFVGDFVDRGPHIRETLHLVRSMTDNGTAEAVMGNHEYNAICFYLKDPDHGGHLRKHHFKNILQHQETIKQFASHEKEWKGWIEWFLQLPMFIENEYLRVVHACWDDKLIAHLKTITRNNALLPEIIYKAQDKGTDHYEAIERTLKGKETTLPNGLWFADKDGHHRTETRTKWWLNAEGLPYNTYFFHQTPELENLIIKPGEFANNNFYAPQNAPVFFGHYWLRGELEIQQSNVLCLDYSIAKEGKLVAYRFNGEKTLAKENMVEVQPL